MAKTSMAKLLITFLLTLLAKLLEAKPAILPTTLLENKSVFERLDVFETGNFNTNTSDVGTSNFCAPPKPLLIVSPITTGIYPIILFHHGTSLSNSWYLDLLQHMASHGYVVVAPQLYDSILPPSATVELDSAAKVANWLPSGLRCALPENVEGDLSKLALAGHSRGGYVAFALALGHANTPLQVKFSAVIGIDPVAGPSKNNQLEPKILTYIPSSFNLSVPVTVIGTGLGNKPVVPFMPACAPDGVSHEQFFYECNSPCSHFETTDYGHMDILNDDIGPWGSTMRSICKGSQWGVKREPMRRSVGGIVVAFLQAYFEDESMDYITILQNPSVAPAKLDSVMIKKEQIAQL